MEGKIDRQSELQRIWELLEATYPNPETELHYNNPYQLAVAVVLSAQCTDARVNKITPDLFAKYPTFSAMAQATPEQIFEYIRSCSYPNNKAKHLYNLATIVTHNYNGELPAEPENLEKLPGIGRKTANVLASVLHQAQVMPVDTHVFRLSHRLKLVDENAKTPNEVEKQLYNVVPQGKIHHAHHWLILHGRYVCMARKPKCHQCSISALCPSVQLTSK